MVSHPNDCLFPVSASESGASRPDLLFYQVRYRSIAPVSTRERCCPRGDQSYLRREGIGGETVSTSTCSSTTTRRSLPKPSDHAQLRWLQRSKGLCSETTVLEAWCEGVPVGLPHYTFHRVRLHSPTGTIIGARNGVIITVLNRGEQEVNDDHLHRCTNCGLLYEVSPDGRHCHWCDDTCGELSKTTATDENRGVPTNE